MIEVILSLKENCLMLNVQFTIMKMSEYCFLFSLKLISGWNYKKEFLKTSYVLYF